MSFAPLFFQLFPPLFNFPTQLFFCAPLSSSFNSYNINRSVTHTSYPTPLHYKNITITSFILSFFCPYMSVIVILTTIFAACLGCCCGFGFFLLFWGCVQFVCFVVQLDFDFSLISIWGFTVFTSKLHLLM
ncbi:hypothetical protein AAZV13_13G007600 [Glycine max]